MPGEPLVEELALDISAALDSIAPLGAALDEMASSFGATLAQAISDASGALVALTPDTSAFTAGIDEAIQALTTTPVEIQADPTALDASIADALDAPRPPIVVDGDASEIITAIDQAIGEPTPPIPIEADTSAIDAAVAQAGAVTLEADTTPMEQAIAAVTGPETVPVDADVSQASDAIDGLFAATETLAVTADTDPLASAISDVVDQPHDVPLSADAAELLAAIEDATGPRTIEVGADTGPAEDAINALAGQVESVQIDADTTGILDAIEAVTGTPQEVFLTADAAELQAVIDGLAGQSVTIPVDADTHAAEEAIASLAGEDVLITVDADTSGAQDAISSLGDSATQAAGGGGGGGIDGLSTSVAALGAATAGAEGGMSGLTSVLGEAGPGAAAAGTAIAAFGGFVGVAVSAAADAEAQQKRFNDTFGATADIVEHIDVGGLTISLKELGAQSGTTEADLEASATRIGLLGNAAGAAKTAVAGTASDLLGLAGALSVANPRMGDTAATADVLSRAFATGRTRALIPYGISISQNDIATRALGLAQAEGRDTATAFDKVQAGLAITLEKQGNTLGTKFAAGAKNAEIQLRALKVAFEENLVAIGQPLLAPVLDVLKDLAPIGLETGKVLGALAQGTLPALKVATESLKSVAPALDALALSVTKIADAEQALSDVPLPSIGLDGLLGADDASKNLDILGVALRGLPGPIGTAFGEMQLFGDAVGLFGDNSDKAKVNTAALTGAFDGIGAAADSGEAGVQSVTKAVDEFVKSALAAGDAGKTGADGQRILGRSAQDTSDALLGTNDGFKAFVNSAKASKDATDDQRTAIKAYVDDLKEGRKALEEQAQVTLKGAVADGTLTQAQVDAAIAASALHDKNGKIIKDTIDYILAVKQVTPALEAKAAAEATSAQSSAASSDAISDLVHQVEAGTLSIPDFAQRLTDLKLSTDDVTKASDLLKASQVAQADATALSSDAAADLFAKFEAGEITSQQLQVELFGIGVSMGAAGSAAQALSADIDSFVSSVVGALPDAGAAVDTFSNTLKDALKGVQDANESTSTAVQSAQKQVQTAQEALDRARQTSSAASDKQAENARLSLQRAQDRLSALQSTGKATAVSIQSAENTVADAQKKLNDALAASGGAGSTAVQNAQRQLDQANKALVDAQAKAGVDVKKAQDDLKKALSPQSFIDDLSAEIKAISDFQQNLATLTAEGFGALAGALAAKGPEAGSQIAQALAGDKTQAAIANQQEILLNNTTANFATFARSHFGELQQVGVDSAGHIVTGYKAGFQLIPQTQEQIDKAKFFIAGEAPALEGVGKAAAVAAVNAFEREFGRLPTVAEFNAGAADQALIDAKTEIGTDAGATGAEGSDKFGAGIGGVPGKATAAVDKAKDAFGGQARIDLANEARHAGLLAGVAFANGLESGVQQKIDTGELFLKGAAAAQAIADGADSILDPGSPSRLGQEQGRNYVEGLALGLGDSDPVAAAGKSLAESLIGSLSGVGEATEKSAAAVGASSAHALSAAFTSNVKLAIPIDKAVPVSPGGLRGPVVPVGRVVVDQTTAQTRQAPATGARTGRPEPIVLNVHSNAPVDPLHLSREIAWALQ